MPLLRGNHALPYRLFTSCVLILCRLVLVFWSCFCVGPCIVLCCLEWSSGLFYVVLPYFCGCLVLSFDCLVVVLSCLSCVYCLVLSCLVLSCVVLCCLALPCRVLSCLLPCWSSMLEVLCIVVVVVCLVEARDSIRCRDAILCGETTHHHRPHRRHGHGRVRDGRCLRALRRTGVRL